VAEELFRNPVKSQTQLKGAEIQKKSSALPSNIFFGKASNNLIHGGVRI
jgi:hypothetical protein